MSSLSDQWFVGNSVCQHSAQPTANYFFLFFFHLVYFFGPRGLNELVVVCLLVDLSESPVSAVRGFTKQGGVFCL